MHKSGVRPPLFPSKERIRNRTTAQCPTVQYGRNPHPYLTVPNHSGMGTIHSIPRLWVSVRLTNPGTMVHPSNPQNHDEVGLPPRSSVKRQYELSFRLDVLLIRATPVHSSSTPPRSSSPRFARAHLLLVRPRPHSNPFQIARPPSLPTLTRTEDRGRE